MPVAKANTGASLTTLPPELQLNILSHLTTYTSLRSLLSASLHFRHLYHTNEPTILSALATHHRRWPFAPLSSEMAEMIADSVEACELKDFEEEKIATQLLVCYWYTIGHPPPWYSIEPIKAPGAPEVCAIEPGPEDMRYMPPVPGSERRLRCHRSHGGCWPRRRQKARTKRARSRLQLGKQPANSGEGLQKKHVWVDPRDNQGLKSTDEVGRWYYPGLVEQWIEGYNKHEREVVGRIWRAVLGLDELMGMPYWMRGLCIYERAGLGKLRASGTRCGCGFCVLGQGVPDEELLYMTDPRWSAHMAVGDKVALEPFGQQKEIGGQ